MNKSLAWIIVFTLLVSTSVPLRSAHAEGGTFEITPMVGVTVGGSVDLPGAQIDFDTGLSYGGMVGMRVRDDALVVMSYHRQSTEAHYTDFGTPANNASVDMNIDYLQFGGEIDFAHKARFSPLLGLTIGATHFSPDVPDVDSNWFFSAILYGGATFRLTKHIGLRAQARFIGTVISNNSSWLCASPVGCVVNVSADGVLQGDFSAGVYVAF
jgi:hypothetical protein